MYCLTVAFHEAGYTDFPVIAVGNSRELRAYCAGHNLRIYGDNGIPNERVPPTVSRAIVIVQMVGGIQHALYTPYLWLWWNANPYAHVLAVVELP